MKLEINAKKNSKYSYINIYSIFSTSDRHQLSYPEL
jgi:hypothetical protein